MFDKIKQKFVRTAKAEVGKEVVKSANGGALYVGAVACELLLIGGAIFLGARGHGSAVSQATTVIIKNCNIILNK